MRGNLSFCGFLSIFKFLLWSNFLPIVLRYIYIEIDLEPARPNSWESTRSLILTPIVPRYVLCCSVSSFGHLRLCCNPCPGWPIKRSVPPSTSLGVFERNISLFSPTSPPEHMHSKKEEIMTRGPNGCHCSHERLETLR